MTEAASGYPRPPFAAPLPALVAAGGVVAAILILNALAMVSNAIASTMYSISRLGLGSLEEWSTPFGVLALANQFLTFTLPVGIGIFLAFGVFWPIQGDRGVRNAVLRAVLAAVVSTALVMIFSTTASLFSILPMAGRDDFLGLISSVIAGFAQAGSGLATILPLAVVAALSLWIWQRRASLTDSRDID